MKPILLIFSMIVSLVQFAEASVIKTKKIDVSEVKDGAENCSTGPIIDSKRN
jgi:hypothetical protein